MKEQVNGLIWSAGLVNSVDCCNVECNYMQMSLSFDYTCKINICVYIINKFSACLQYIYDYIYS